MDVEVVEQTDLFQDDLVCTVCFAEFLDQEDLQVHIKQLHLNVTNKNRYCELCVHIFHDIEEYALHLRNKHINSLKCCKYCTRLFETALKVQEHEKKHNGAALYPKVSCSHCKNVFDSKEEVKNHEYKEHSDSIEGLMLSGGLPILSSLLCMNIYNFFNSVPYKCVICDKTTGDVNAYIQHLVDNKKCRAHTCNECCKVFKRKCRLRTHMLTHIQESVDPRDLSIQCRKCKQLFKQASLRSHKKTCTGMCCALCNLYFESVAEYTNHRLAEHKKKMPLLEVCIYCQRQIVGAETLKKHIERVHADKHLYKYHCTDCKRIFKHPKFLFAHFFSQHKDLHPYTCQICDKTFRVRKGFTLHIKLTHNSVGFVEFDDNFHVYFTNKKTDKQSKSQTEPENSDDDEDEDDGSNYDTNDHNYCGNPNSFEVKYKTENDCKIEIDKTENKMENKFNDTYIKPKKELGLEPKDIKFNESNDKDQIIKENVVTVQKNNQNKNVKNTYDDTTTDCELVEGPVKKVIKKPLLKRKRNDVKKSQIKDVEDDDGSSDDSNIPLQTVSKKLKLLKNKTRTSFKRLSAQTKKFICKTCNRNCYTYQNYHRHKALHTKNETKVCIKCYEKFDSVKKLNEHIKMEHSSSQLTETLKKMLEKRKIAEAKLKEEAKSRELPIPKDDATTLQEVMPLSTTEKFCNTIKKFNNERNIPTKVTIKLIDKDKISVKKYLENFTPDNNEVKIRVIKDPVSLETARVKKRPLIKLTKFTPEPIIHEKVNLKLPVKFTDDRKEKFQVSMKLVYDYQAPAMTFNTKIDDNCEEYYDNYDTYESYEPEEDNKDVIPEVAQEVMLEGTEVQNSVIHTMNLKGIPSWHNKIRIAHLSAEAPYFKISKVNLGEEDSFTLLPETDKKENKIETPKDITLPSGKKLVSVNPFEHLIDKKTIDEIKSSKKSYKPRIRNVAEAIKTAIQKLEQTPPIKEKKKK